jgi:ABC-type phosphate/phosphonate transport system substrate-binding protein
MALLMTKNPTLWKIILAAFCIFTTISAASADLILSAPPRENERSGVDDYEPIAKLMSQVLGTKVVYKHPHNWTEYAAEMRAGSYDFVFDGPHFAAWRMKNVQHVPLVRLSGSLGFVVVAKSDDDGVKSLRDLLGKSICGLASPNLGTVSVFSLYDNPVYQPEFVNVKGGMREVMQTFMSSDKCRAAVLRDDFYNALPDAKKKQVKVLATSPSMPNQTLTVSTRVKPDDRAKLEKALTSTEGASAGDQLLERFSKKQKFFVPAKTEEYANLERLLEGVVFGW